MPKRHAFLDTLKLSIDEIREIKGCEKLTDSEADQLADFLAFYAIAVFEIAQKI